MKRYSPASTPLLLACCTLVIFSTLVFVPYGMRRVWANYSSASIGENCVDLDDFKVTPKPVSFTADQYPLKTIQEGYPVQVSIPATQPVEEVALTFLRKEGCEGMRFFALQLSEGVQCPGSKAIHWYEGIIDQYRYQLSNFPVGTKKSLFTYLWAACNNSKKAHSDNPPAKPYFRLHWFLSPAWAKLESAQVNVYDSLPPDASAQMRVYNSLPPDEGSSSPAAYNPVELQTYQKPGAEVPCIAGIYPSFAAILRDENIRPPGMPDKRDWMPARKKSPTPTDSPPTS